MLSPRAFTLPSKLSTLEWEPYYAPVEHLRCWTERDIDMGQEDISWMVMRMTHNWTRVYELRTSEKDHLLPLYVPMFSIMPLWSICLAIVIDFYDSDHPGAGIHNNGYKLYYCCIEVTQVCKKSQDTITNYTYMQYSPSTSAVIPFSISCSHILFTSASIQQLSSHFCTVPFHPFHEHTLSWQIYSSHSTQLPEPRFPILNVKTTRKDIKHDHLPLTPLYISPLNTRGVTIYTYLSFHLLSSLWEDQESNLPNCHITSRGS